MAELNLQTQFPPISGRVHEVCGPGADVFVAVLCGQLNVFAFWFQESWRRERLNPLGLSEYFDPSKLLLAKPKDQSSLLAVAEDALRDGSAPLVVIELSKPLTLTEARRLQLAADNGRSTGVCIIAETHGSNAAETRWKCEPIFDQQDSTRHNWKLIKNKRGTLGSWNVRWDASARRIIVVPSVRQRPGS